MKRGNIDTCVIGHFMYFVYIYSQGSRIPQIDIKNSEYHSYNTRSAEYYNIPPNQLDLSKARIKYRGAIIWNRIAQTGINLNVSEAVLKKCVIRLLNKNEL